MNTPPRPPLKSLDAALAELLAQGQPLPGSELLDTFDADGRVLAEDLVAALQVPPFDNSAMDGYALRAADLSGPELALPVSQRIAAGSIGEPLAAGTAARIFTGAAVPLGADAVVMQEECTLLEDGRVQINAAVKPGQNIRKSGEDMQRGSTVLTAGKRLGPAELGLAASMGCARLAVARRPRVALFSTGDELVIPGDVAPQDLPAGSIYNSNRFFLRAMLQRLGCEVQDLGIVPDSYEATVAALQAAAENSDLVLTSGGVSVGEEDHVKPAVQALGSLDLWAIAIKPGKPFAYGRVGQAHFIGLPGNPVSSFVTFALLVRPFLLCLQGVQAHAPQAVDMRADFDWPRADKRREFLRVRVNAQGGLDRFANQGSGVLTSAVWADGLVDNPAGQTIAQGDTVRFVPFAQLLG
ncbi:molybdopterin molybdotransferase [Comamonas sp. BIGb0152]|uniref:molybdopterin molybdotransferase MoeA n=1 Tax=Comamonas sp. BIGb0152 TaxID=2940601 RepID=UPI002167C8F0|nr:gephyrin-like molybdotransferase Glp [Comamonas sp. BIGb0152]MCS4295338.1 molybdopterin molybdotransferase [Comamonas sp. BIGb0152]